jgi:hypothetical protein
MNECVEAVVAIVAGLPLFAAVFVGLAALLGVLLTPVPGERRRK